MILADTNVILRWAHPRAVMRPAAWDAVKLLRGRGETIVISAQNQVEFWSVATRPVSANGLGFPPSRADHTLSRLERYFRLVEDVPAIHPEWRKLVAVHAVSGRQVHDARLAAVMRVHGIAQILTFNTADFARYPGITAIHPASVGTTP